MLLGRVEAGGLLPQFCDERAGQHIGYHAESIADHLLPRLPCNFQSHETDDRTGTPTLSTAFRDYVSEALNTSLLERRSVAIDLPEPIAADYRSWLANRRNE